MKYIISQIRVKGIKNIDKEIEIQFYDKTIKKPFSIQNSNIKALYGENGVGKSGIVHAIKIYNDLVNSSSYLYESKNRSYVSELTNNISNRLSICVDFIEYDYPNNDTGTFKKFSHSLVLNSKSSTNVFIENEMITSIKRGSYREDKAEVFFISNSGQIVQSEFTDTMNEYSKNKLSKESIVTIFANSLLKDLVNDFVNSSNERKESVTKEFIDKYYNEFRILNPIRVFNRNLNVYMNESDDHTYFLDATHREDNIHIPLDNGEILIDKNFSFKMEDLSSAKLPRSQYSEVVNKDRKNEYIKYVKRLEEFIKIFKNSLMEISVEFRPHFDNDMQNADLILKYKNGNNVALEFESTGIKKLVTLFDAFSKIDLGEIVVIDEFDANLHDVYLLKIIEYFSQFSRGQFFFTTHNLGPMEILKEMKHSIDFLSNDSRLTSWKKNGNYSIVKLYRKGLIQNLPFNVETTDFIGVFSDFGDNNVKSR